MLERAGRQVLRWVFGTGLTIALFALSRGTVHGASDGAAEPVLLHAPDAVCASCHREIYERYIQTPMAQASGLAATGFIPGGFSHKPSGISYAMSLRDGRAYLSYARKTGPAPGQIAGEKQMQLYIGSGRRGRTYLFENQGFWFEAPVNYYGKKEVWDMAPAYGAAREMPFTLPVDANCLHCHAGEVQTALPGARNRYATVPFKAGGVPCSSCHGDGAAHVATHGRAPIANPVKMTANSRDSVCLQCHLEGEATVYRPGRSLAEFTAGGDLSEYAVYFVGAQTAGQDRRATSQWEALLRSACKRASGDKLTCTTCHDPHGSPGAAEKVEFYRGKCLTCHTDARFATTHHPEERDCASCHMPERKSGDIPHEQITDHHIVKRMNAAQAEIAGQGSPQLVPVGDVKAGDREYGLAYAQKAQAGNRESGYKALEFLQRAEAAGANDVEIHVELGFLKQVSGDRNAAEKEYRAALALDAENTTALANLAVLKAGEGKGRDASALLRRVVQNNPAEAASAHNLALLECSAGDLQDAEKTLRVLLEFSPDDGVARTMLERWLAGKGSCRF